MKNTLKFLLILHILSLLIINYNALTVLIEKKTKFNKISNQIVPYLKQNKISKNTIEAIGIYENFLGADRGFEFFSPNTSNVENKLIFIGNNKEQLYLLNSIEGSLKYYTFNSYINPLLANTGSRDFILRNICAHLFQKHQKINEISVFIVTTTVSELYNREVSEKNNNTLIAKIKKNE
ncbi:hypothetical protein [Chryseobacterium candidae]|uniref:Uncharacterized protein n=1 Tax=Chryseobacterium candidae TaxID=1978493 RepID=A0ABY2R6Y2_9FLAO|nr:hypothetical protein [Chryseobacterium candidae]THV59836.1 hypothetical protein EK417_10325 [Chryseobacterium candidae]